MNIENFMGQSEGTQIRDLFKGIGIELPEFPAPGYEPPGVYRGQQVVDAFRAYNVKKPGSIDMSKITAHMTGSQIRDAFAGMSAVAGGNTGGTSNLGNLAGTLAYPKGSVSSGVVAGEPGHFTGPTPANKAALFNADQSQPLAATAGVPDQPWSGGEYVLLGDGTKVYWAGESWYDNAARMEYYPTTLDTHSSHVGRHDFADLPDGKRQVEVNDLATLRSLGALGQTTAWTSGMYLRAGADHDAYYWDGTTWQIGKVP